MSRSLHDLEQWCARALQRHLEVGDERTLSDAYELGRAALAEDIGVLEMMLALWRAMAELRRSSGLDPLPAGFEGFMLECLSPFEMAHRGVREANDGLRRLGEQREEQVRRVGRELHDEAGQLLACVHLALEELRPHLEPGGETRLTAAMDLLRRVEEEIRRLSHELRPAILEDLGLVPALSFLGKGVAHRSKISVAVLGSTEGRMSPRIETALYRAAQEGLNNVARHARASGAVIEVKRTEREVFCTIRDDGCGFDPNLPIAPGRRRGLGLDGIRERLGPLGGTLEVSTRPGEGTELTVRIPLEVTRAHALADR